MAEKPTTTSPNTPIYFKGPTTFASRGTFIQYNKSDNVAFPVTFVAGVDQSIENIISIPTTSTSEPSYLNQPCTSGQYSCIEPNSPMFLQCNNNHYVMQSCGPGTVCKTTRNSIGIYCGFPSSDQN
ncbi:hypothetical protein BB561_005359 [Smittium simulii]|uniref:Carbohydrate-binding module family 19 domain-containing protein n=1 Tax=Smittium simulii TaxID=133385 RepID=A0A2T9YAQ6_9FUNG|nr:hypothetical protein BB561_005359 [Smittium simulii]